LDVRKFASAEGFERNKNISTVSQTGRFFDIIFNISVTADEKILWACNIYKEGTVRPATKKVTKKPEYVRHVGEEKEDGWVDDVKKMLPDEKTDGVLPCTFCAHEVFVSMSTGSRLG
jgi:hypothetical protein